MGKLPKGITIIFLILGVYLLLLLIVFPLIFEPTTNELFINAFKAASNGLVVLLGAYVGWIAIYSFIEKQTEKKEIKKNIKAYRKQFPIEEFGENKKFVLLDAEHSDAVYIGKITKHKDKKYKLYHIANRRVKRDLDLYAIPSYPISTELIKICNHGKTIRTRGEVGT